MSSHPRRPEDVVNGMRPLTATVAVSSLSPMMDNFGEFSQHLHNELVHRLAQQLLKMNLPIVEHKNPYTMDSEFRIQLYVLNNDDHQALWDHFFAAKAPTQATPYWHSLAELDPKPWHREILDTFEKSLIASCGSSTDHPLETAKKDKPPQPTTVTRKQQQPHYCPALGGRLNSPDGPWWGECECTVEVTK